MAFLQVQFFSSALNVASSVNVILPESAQGIGIDSAGNAELPKVLYLLHGSLPMSWNPLNMLSDKSLVRILSVLISRGFSL